MKRTRQLKLIWSSGLKGSSVVKNKNVLSFFFRKKMLTGIFSIFGLQRKKAKIAAPTDF